MSVCTFLAADCPLPEVMAPAYPLHFDLDRGTVCDGDADDNFSLLRFRDADLYSSKAHGVVLEWNYYTEGRANQLISYIQQVLRHTDSVELHHVWLADYYEYEESPVKHRKTIKLKELTTAHIKALAEAEIWNTPDKIYPNRPSFYCLTVEK